MATAAPTNFDVNTLRSQMVATYDRVAREPHAHFHFHRGLTYARDFLDYNGEELAGWPACRRPRPSATDSLCNCPSPRLVGLCMGGRLR